MPCDWPKGTTPFQRRFSFKRRLKRHKTIRFENDTKTVRKRRFGQNNRSCHCTASKTYIGSVLFRTSAYTGAKQANRVPTGSKQDNSPHNDHVKDVVSVLESELTGPV